LPALIAPSNAPIESSIDSELHDYTGDFQLSALLDALEEDDESEPDHPRKQHFNAQKVVSRSPLEWKPRNNTAAYSFSMTAALLEDEVISMQFVEGASDLVVFENFLYYTLDHLRSHEKYKHRPIVALVDNARTHSHEEIGKMKTTIIYNAQWSNCNRLSSTE
jgi:hypothetical protein